MSSGADIAALLPSEASCSAAQSGAGEGGIADLFPAGDWRGMRFAAISLWQPYASLPLLGLKPWETRNRPYPAKYHERRVLVASTKAFTPKAMLPGELDGLCEYRFGPDYERTLPRGMALYTIVLKGCERTEDGVHKVPPELLCTGDFSPGRWMWEWGDVEPLNPFPIHGGQGWWFCDVPDGAFRCATVEAPPLSARPGEGGPALTLDEHNTGGSDE